MSNIQIEISEQGVRNVQVNQQVNEQNEWYAKFQDNYRSEEATHKGKKGSSKKSTPSRRISGVNMLRSQEIDDEENFLPASKYDK